MPKLLYQGHGSLRLTADDGRVIFIDPYVGGGYDVPADVILVTHGHGDHNKTELITQKPGCTVITHAEALAGGKYNAFDVSGIKIEAVEAYNGNHDKSQCVGYIVTLDGVTVYAAGDTSTTAQMDTLAAKNLDYALYPIDGRYNMGPEEAALCAKTVAAKHNIPYHMAPGELFDRERAEMFDAPNRMIIAAGEEITL